MQKILLLFVLAATLFSCSNDDNNESTLILQKVVFYKGSANERQWNIENGLLTNITLANGTVAESFTYDNQNRVTKEVKYTNGLASETNIIAYNADNTISSINGLAYNFNTATQTYTYSYGSNFTINCQVNSDMLATNFTRTGSNAGQYHMAYANGNMTSFEKTTNGSADILKNFHFDAEFGINPIYNAIIAVARVKSLTDPNFFIDCQVSKNMANGFDKGSTDPFYYNYGSLPDRKLLQIGIEVLDGNNNFVDFYSFADYHYQ
jgi:hypothetical protein